MTTKSDVLKRVKKFIVWLDAGQWLAFAVVCAWFLALANPAAAQSLDLHFMDVIKNSAESIFDHPIWAAMLGLYALGCIIMWGWSHQVRYLIVMIIPILVAGVMVNWRSVMSTFIPGVQF